jgi:hypothetical protein
LVSYLGNYGRQRPGLAVPQAVIHALFISIRELSAHPPADFSIHPYIREGDLNRYNPNEGDFL